MNAVNPAMPKSGIFPEAMLARKEEIRQFTNGLIDDDGGEPMTYAAMEEYGVAGTSARSTRRRSAGTER